MRRMSGRSALVTGFEPFDGWTINTSQLVAEQIGRLDLDDVVTAVLPTSYERCTSGLHDLIGAHDPSAVLMLGLGEATHSIQLEQVALNLDDADGPDNDGEIRQRHRIIDSAPVGYWSSLDLKAMARVARRLGHEVTFSHDAGAYVCNHLFYTAAHFAATSEPSMVCGFVHLPPVAGPGERLTGLIDVVVSWLEVGALGLNNSATDHN